ncbi:hypothetical protein L198_07591 [Cryptococcus wingfieldii CBS 7118]|uniref:Uncharacterized protein n=1 Tax=Cryptococcus wingfieldii CBS 7118 TaxID=1295528 RepID=A0A1E3I9L7_9TREE|nr:hypothetical protein L198_07591 [Cryptococcus wingfieldii CBS 7118]ODN85267.1 hypothetical protein L198_07591 [Cryptococcus wingfieldii CBS 7118]
MDSSSSLQKVHPLGVFPEQVTTRETTLIILGSLGWNCANFTVQDEQGREVMKGHPGGIKSSMTGEDGKVVYEIHRRLGFSKKICTVSSAGREIMEVVQKNMSFKTRMTATFTDAIAGDSRTLSLLGDWKAKNFGVKTEDGDEVACVKRSYRKHWGYHYALTVAEGVDLVLISALAVSLVVSSMEDEQAVVVA